MLGYLGRAFDNYWSSTSRLLQTIKYHPEPKYPELSEEEAAQLTVVSQSPREETTAPACHSHFYLHLPCLSAHTLAYFVFMFCTLLADKLVQKQTCKWIQVGSQEQQIVVSPQGLSKFAQAHFAHFFFLTHMLNQMTAEII